MAGWLIWLIVAAVLAVAETSTMSFVLVMFAGGAVAASVTDAAGGPLFLQVVVFGVVSLLLIAIARPFIRRHLATTPAAVTGSAALVGQEAIVLREVTAYDGRVRLNGGEWSARAVNREHILPAGMVVRVARISGATAFVVPEQSVPTPWGKQ